MTTELWAQRAKQPKKKINPEAIAGEIKIKMHALCDNWEAVLSAHENRYDVGLQFAVITRKWLVEYAQAQVARELGWGENYPPPTREHISNAIHAMGANGGEKERFLQEMDESIAAIIKPLEKNMERHGV